MQYGSIGWSVGATLGYAQAVPEKRVIACIGDGSFQVYNQESLLWLELSPWKQLLTCLYLLWWMPYRWLLKMCRQCCDADRSPSFSWSTMVDTPLKLRSMMVHTMWSRTGTTLVWLTQSTTEKASAGQPRLVYNGSLFFPSSHQSMNVKNSETLF